MTGALPQLRIRQAPLTATDKTPRVRISIGGARRDLPVIDARHIADKIHDMCDHLSEHTTTAPDTHTDQEAQP